MHNYIKMHILDRILFWPVSNKIGQNSEQLVNYLIMWLYQSISMTDLIVSIGETIFSLISSFLRKKILLTAQYIFMLTIELH